MTERTLVLVRHARAVPHCSGGDRARPLSAAGLAQARALGCLLARGIPRVDRGVCSTAVRAVETLEALAESLDVRERWRDDALYLCDAPEIFEVVRTFDDECRVALVVGHEPSISSAGVLLTRDEDTRSLLAPGVPSATALVARFESPWSDLPVGGCTLQVRHRPPRA